MNRDGGAERLIWRPIPRPIFCTTTCDGGTSEKPRLDSMPPGDEERTGEEPAGGGFTPRADGGNGSTRSTMRTQEDASPSYYEREIARLHAVIRDRPR